jgi:hypothetical protein
MGRELVLFRPVEMECDCCGVRSQFTFKAQSDLAVCKSCQRHQGAAKIQLRERDHLGLWRSEFALREEEIARLQAQVRSDAEERKQLVESHHREMEHQREGFRMELLGKHAEDTRRWFESQAIADAENKRDGAYRARDAAMRVLWRLAQLHEAVDAARCRCGKPATTCPDLDVLEEEIAYLNSWERNQIERAEKGRPHGLPLDHPKYREWWF